MVVDRYFDDLASLNQIPGGLDVRFTWGWITAGMIMNQDNRRRICDNRRLENFAGMDQQRVKRAVADHFKPDGF